MATLGPVELLREELNARTLRNSSYSVRAFARDAGVSPAFCSQVLNRKRALSEDTAIQIASKLKWNTNKKKLFVLLARYESAKSAEARIELVSQINKLDHSYFKSRKIDLDVFKYLVDWHYFAILELSRTQGFRSDPSWIAQRLGVTSREVRGAIQLLVRLGFLRQENAQLIRVDENMNVGDIPSDWIRLHHSQAITRALAAVESQSFNERLLSTVTFAINPDRLPEANKLIQNFRREMMALLEQDPRQEVYQLSIQLFRLTQKS